MCAESYAAIERLRERLTAQVSMPLTVSDRGRTYEFDEDSSAFADLDIQGPIGDSDFRVVVLFKRPTTSLTALKFFSLTWRGRAREMWIVDEEASTITRMFPDGVTEVLGEEDTLTSTVLPEVAVAVDAIFSEQEQT